MPGVFAVLLLRYQRPLYRLCYRIGRYREEALGLCQEAYLQMHRYRSGFEGRRSIETRARGIAVKPRLWAIDRRARHGINGRSWFRGHAS
ncbi:hypothetical protein CMK11_16710 [Candidatus Poribacteria bacterium]|nr:hypothetical protein [Candidatus Poribacteria bacterium]